MFAIDQPDQDQNLLATGEPSIDVKRGFADRVFAADFGAAFACRIARKICSSVCLFFAPFRPSSIAPEDHAYRFTLTYPWRAFRFGSINRHHYYIGNINSHIR